MFTKWTIRVVNSQAEKELESLPEDLRVEFLAISDSLEKLGPVGLGMPYVKFLRNKLWEIRLHGMQSIARSIFVMITEREVLILNTFIKRTQQTPLKEIKLAEKRLKRWKNEREENKRSTR